jgi:PleD family two-component response regulator
MDGHSLTWIGVNNKMNSEKSNAGDVLIVDDVPEDLTILRKMLEEQNYRVRPAINGTVALRAVSSSPPEIILLDILMPEMDGYEFCQRLKSDEKTKFIPVIFISALAELNEKVKAFSLGGVDYITKPFQDKEILTRVKTHLTIRRLQQHLEEKNNKLQKTLDEIKTLQGIIPICASCKNIRDDEGFWKQVEVYFTERSDAMFSHSVCPDCREKLYADIM